MIGSVGNEKVEIDVCLRHAHGRFGGLQSCLVMTLSTDGAEMVIMRKRGLQDSLWLLIIENISKVCVVIYPCKMSTQQQMTQIEWIDVLLVLTMAGGSRDLLNMKYLLSRYTKLRKTRGAKRAKPVGNSLNNQNNKMTFHRNFSLNITNNYQ